MLWVAIPILLVGFWFGVSQLLASLSGWRELAQKYGVGSVSSFTRKTTGGRIGGVAYNGCLVVGANAEGVALSVLLLFRPGHAPIFVPWAELSMGAEGSVAGATRLRFRAAPQVTLELPEIVADWLRSAAPSAAPPRVQAQTSGTPRPL